MMKMKRNYATRLFSILLAVTLSASFTLSFSRSVAVATPAADRSPSEEQTGGELWETKRYLHYLESYANAAHPDTKIPIDVKNPSAQAGDVMASADIAGKSGLLTGGGTAGEFVEYRFLVPETGLYALNIEYYAYAGKGSSIERSLLIDGRIPYREAGGIRFSRLWKDGEEPQTDTAGNEMQPEQVEIKQWREQFVSDSSGVYDRPLQFYLEEGEHTLRLTSVQEPLLIGRMEFCQPKQPASYQEVLKKWQQEGAVNASKGDKVQAEDMVLKSQPTIYATNDRGSAAVEPNSTTVLLNNILSGGRFQNTGEWVKWEITAPETGFYQIALKTRQNVKDGGYSVRRLLIDGEVPFAEAEALRFDYSSKWEMTVLGNEEPYLFYLEKGPHELELQVAMGDFSEIVSRTNEAVDLLNKAYRDILVITGPTPDLYRDYQFPMFIPDTLAELERVKNELESIIQAIEEAAGENGSFVSVFRKLILDLEQITEEPESIPKKMNNFKSNISALADWTITAQGQPVDLDYICLVPPEGELPRANAGFFSNLWFSIQLFLASFTVDYNALGGTEDGGVSVKVWLGNSAIPGAVTGSGRDQAMIMQRLVRSSYKSASGASVQFQLVAPGTLLPSVLSGMGPDVVLQMNADEPVNYAIRGAVMPLNEFEGFDEVLKRFYPETVAPYTFLGNTYALPETLTYPVLYYRKDILKELGVAVPQTWEDVYSAIFKLQNKSLEFGMPPDMSGYLMFLFQRGEEIYNDDGSKVTFDTEQGINAFHQWTDFFYSYKSPVTYNFLNRFRTGEMPVGIADVTFYNQLSVFAPEIAGLWGIALVPGTKNASGEIDRTVSSGGVGCAMMEQTKHPEEAWEFMQWWTSAQTQAAYSEELESVMGIAARYPTANREALEGLAWSAADAQVLAGQREYIKGVRQVPGSYILARYIDFAYKAVVTEGEDAGKQIMEYTRQINHELARKRREFGLGKGE